jgi:hypothetical protein
MDRIRVYFNDGKIRASALLTFSSLFSMLLSRISSHSRLIPLCSGTCCRHSARWMIILTPKHKSKRAKREVTDNLVSLFESSHRNVSLPFPMPAIFAAYYGQSKRASLQQKEARDRGRARW